MDGDEIKVAVAMKVTAKSGVKADETLELIQIGETITGQYLNFKTEFGKDMGLKQFLTNTTLNVDYKSICSERNQVEIDQYKRQCIPD